MDDRIREARSDVLARHSSTALIVLPADGPAMKLEGPAESVWELITTGATAEQIVEAVASSYGVDPSTVRAFVTDTIGELEQADVIDRLDPDGSVS